MVLYTIAKPDEYLAITGAGIRTVRIAKKGFIWPMQRVCLAKRSQLLRS